MPLLTFDPERVGLLRRALDDLVLTVERLQAMQVQPEIQDVLLRARRSSRAALVNVEESLREFAAGRGVDSPPCREPVDSARHFTRWTSSSSHWWTKATTQSETRGDEILAEFACDREPWRAGELIDSMPSIEDLVLGVANLAAMEKLWMDATDPRTTSPELAGRRIKRLLTVIFDERSWERGVATGSIDPVERSRRDVALRHLAARISAPWQIHFSGLPQWQWTASEGARRLHQLAELETGADILLSGLAGAVRRSLAELPEDHAGRIERIDAVARGIGTSLEVRRIAEVERAHAGSGFDTLRSVLSTLSIDGPWPISLLVDAGAEWVGGYFDTADERVRATILEGLALRQVLATVAAAAVVNAALVQISKSEDRPSMDRMRSNLAVEVRHAYQSIDNAAGRGQALAQLTAP